MLDEPLLRVFSAARRAVVDPLLMPWLRLAALRGPSPHSGPLHHDLLLPTPQAPDRFGINVFGHGSDADLRALVNRSAPAVCSDLLDAVQDATWSAGLYVDQRGPRLKLYLTGALSAALRRWPVGLPPCQPIALGVDLTAEGPQRHRVYLMSQDPACARLETGWRFHAPGPWPPAHPGMAHGLLTAGAHTQKRTRNWIYRPDAPLDLLRSRLPQDHRQALDAITAQRLPPGLEWAPVALEADSFADGQLALDWLLTLRATGKSVRRNS